jgi:hypothetical protein
VVWGLLLQDDPEGPTLIDYIVVAKRVVCRRLVLLVAHLKDHFHGELNFTRGGGRFGQQPCYAR